MKNNKIKKKVVNRHKTLLKKLDGYVLMSYQEAIKSSKKINGKQQLMKKKNQQIKTKHGFQ